MRVILCYGDSNTWGYEPGTGNRYPREKVWTGVLRRELGENYFIIDEGLNGRTTVWDDPAEIFKRERNGKEYLIPCLGSHRPIDIVAFMLGTNDLKERFSVTAYEIAKSMGTLVEIVQKSEAGPDGGPPEVLLLAPPQIGKLTEFAEEFEGAKDKSKKLAGHYQRIAEELGCEFLDTSEIIVSSDIDGIHLELGAHQKLGKAVAKYIQKRFS